MRFYSRVEMLPEGVRIWRITDTISVEPHRHEFIELIYIREGSSIQMIGGVSYPVVRGDLLFVSYEQVHSFRTQNLTYTNILLEPSFLCGDLPDTGNISQLLGHSMFSEFGSANTPTAQCVHFTGRDRDEVEVLVTLMETEFAEKKSGYRSLLCGCMRMLFTMMLRNLSTMRMAPSTSTIRQDSSPSSQTDRIPEILRYIDENCGHHLSLEDIAAYNFYNPTHLGRLLKKYCGKSFTAYVKECRMNRASGLLLATGDTVEAVMTKVGYRDKKLFYRHFRETFGTSPGEYRSRKTGYLPGRMTGM